VAGDPATGLPAYERRRNAAAAPGYAQTLEFARLQPPGPEQQELFAALRGDQALTDRFFGTVVGTVDPAELFAPAPA
jgi:hypothetical protein